MMGIASGIIFLGLELRVGIRLRPFDLLIILGVLLLANSSRRRYKLDIDYYSFIAVCTLFYIITLLNGALLNSLTVGVKEFIQSFIFIAYLVVCITAIRNDQDFIIFAKAFFVTLWVIALWNAFYHISSGQISGWKSLDEPKLTHGFILLSMVAYSLNYRIRDRVWILILFTAIMMLLLSGDRKGWVSAAAGISVIVLLIESRRITLTGIVKATYKLLIFIPIAAILFSVLSYIPYFEKQIASSMEFLSIMLSGVSGEYASLETTISNRARLFVYELATDLYAANPIFGVGVESYKDIVDRLNVPDFMKKGAHNELLRVASEMGSVGLISYGLIYLVILLRLSSLVLKFEKYRNIDQLKIRMGLGGIFYAMVVNQLLAGGALNTFFIFFPAILIFSVKPVQLGSGPGFRRRTRAITHATSRRPWPI